MQTSCLHHKFSIFTDADKPLRTLLIIAFMSATEHIIGNKKKKPQVIGPSIMLSIYFFIKSYFPPLMKRRKRKGKCNKIVERSDTDELPMLVDDAK